MSSLRREAVRVIVPATSANLGPGFDTAGLALDVHDEYVAMISDDPGVLIEVVGEGADVVPRDDSHLVVQAMNAVFDLLGVHPSGMVLRCANVIPHGRGLGSSAAAIIGGMVLARAMVDDGAERMDDIELLQAALAFESHPDNLAAALFGGFTIAWTEANGRADAVRHDVHPDVAPVVMVPPTQVATSKARSVLPATVALADASANIARSALLVHALTADPSRLLSATEDRLHQQARSVVYADSVELVGRLRAQGLAAVISGAGPTVLAFAPAEFDQVIAAGTQAGWLVRRVAVAEHGARVVPLAPLA